MAQVQPSFPCCVVSPGMSSLPCVCPSMRLPSAHITCPEGGGGSYLPGRWAQYTIAIVIHKDTQPDTTSFLVTRGRSGLGWGSCFKIGFVGGIQLLPTWGILKASQGVWA